MSKAKEKAKCQDPAHKEGLIIRQEHLWPLLLQSVRYALGRMTYAVTETISMVKEYASFLSEAECRQLQREIQEEITRAVAQGRFVGMECDHREWAALATWLEDRLKEKADDGS